jgi:RNA polymerase sigma-54 factor
MRSGPYVELRQGQSLAMAPQVLQSIKLLQFSYAELITYLEAELERNPFLQRSGIKIPAVAESRPIGPSPAPRTGSSRIGDILPDLEATLADTVSLANHLEAQLALVAADTDVKDIGLHLIHSLDEAGYLTDDLDDIADRLSVGPDRVAAALGLVQDLDPAGVGARTLAECLSLQLREQGRFDPAMEALLTRLDLVAKQDLPALRRLCGVDTDDIVEMLAEIRRLDPKPGLSFGSPRIDVLVPDVLVRPAPDGGFQLELNPNTLPKVLLDQTYYAHVALSARGEKDKAFLSDCFQNAQWLTRSLDQRAGTILKVATEIVRQQREFFSKGAGFLRPLILKNVAEAIGMHESTVSRVVANKAIGTEQGTFVMKYFFNAATGEAGHSSEAVRHRIKQIVDAEDPRDALSDDAITSKLKSEGIDVARRTVAKYRQALRISSSADRRRTGTVGAMSRYP